MNKGREHGRWVRRMLRGSVLLTVVSSVPVIAATDRPDRLDVTRTGSASSVMSVAPWDSMPVDVATHEWNLTHDQWQRYLTLMQGRARYFATDMPPPMVLALFARDDAERDRYTELLARFERDKADRLLAVQRSYDAAMARLFPNEKIIDLDILRRQGLLPATTTPGTPTTASTVPGLSSNKQGDVHLPRFGDRLALFAAPDCVACGDRVRMLASKHSIAPLEIYFKGESSDLKQWLKSAGLEPAWLKKNGITFARDEGQSDQYQAAPGTVFIVRGEALYEMAL